MTEADFGHVITAFFPRSDAPLRVVQIAYRDPGSYTLDKQLKTSDIPIMLTSTTGALVSKFSLAGRLKSGPPNGIEFSRIQDETLAVSLARQGCLVVETGYRSKFLR